MLEWGRKASGVVQILSGDAVAGTVRQAAMRERAAVDIGGTPWTYYKESGRLLGERDGLPQPTMQASRPSIMKQAWEIEADGSAYRIEPAGFLRSRYRVLRNDAEIGDSTKAGFWSNRPVLDVDPATPLEHRVFLLWVCFIMRRRSAAAAGASGGG